MRFWQKRLKMGNLLSVLPESCVLVSSRALLCMDFRYYVYSRSAGLLQSLIESLSLTYQTSAQIWPNTMQHRPKLWNLKAQNPFFHLDDCLLNGLTKQKLKLAEWMPKRLYSNGSTTGPNGSAHVSLKVKIKFAISFLVLTQVEPDGGKYVGVSTDSVAGSNPVLLSSRAKPLTCCRE